ncbi:MAG: penicillin acylase family protein [Solirubrobacterales bacterium]
MRRFLALVLVLGGALAVPAMAAADGGPTDYAATALNIIPSGQYGSGAVTPATTKQAQMYDGLTPLFDQVGNSDLTTYFKSEALGLGTDGPGTNEPVPKAGVTITRDAYNVPHVHATTYSGGIWAAGWIAAEDRGLLLQQARYNARVAAIDAPGLSAIGLVAGLHSFAPSPRTEAEVAKQTQVLKNAGKEGRAVLRDIDTFISGINDYLAIHSPSTAPWTRNDVYAVNALKDQFLGEGGGDEARRSQFLGGLRKRLGSKRAWSVFNDLRQQTNAGSPTSIDGKFPYERVPKNHSGSVILDSGSFQATPAVSRVPRAARPALERRQASNTLMISGRRSNTGKPLMVGGPQIGYFYPGLTYEIDMDAPHLVWRGATSAPFPGYLLIGRGQDFATTLTSASGDVIDQFAETLCGGSSERYLFKGKCRKMGHFNAGVLDGTQQVSFLTTVHGPVIGYAKVQGRKVALAAKRSSYGKDVLDLLFNRRLSNGSVKSPKTFFEAASKTPQTFNSFYIDSKHIAEYTSGLLPIRERNVDPGLPAKGTGRYEWRGFLSKNGHPHGTDPRNGRIVNWNNSVAHGFGAADDEWGRNGSAARVDLLNYNLDRLVKNGKWSLASVTSAMNAAATQDVRAIDTVPLLRRLLQGSAPPNAQAQQMLDLLAAWRSHGGSRLDKDLDGKIDDPGAAIMDAAWPKIADAFMKPWMGSQLDELASLFSRFDQPPGGQYSGWYQYFDRDIHRLLGDRVPQPFANRYCGKGSKSACRKAVWNALAAAGTELTADQGTSDPSAWRASATAEQIHFTPLNLLTMRYTNRPSGIQQVISFKGHR